MTILGLLFCSGCQTTHSSRSYRDHEKNEKLEAMVEAAGWLLYFLAPFASFLYYPSLETNATPSPTEAQSDTSQ